MTVNVLNELRRIDRFYDDESKWCKGAFNDGAAFCLVGAIRGCYTVADALRKSLSVDSTCKLIDWNDAPNRTFADVKNLLACTIERVSREEHDFKE